MAKKKTPVYVSHKEILCLAINELNRQIDGYEETGKGKGADAQAVIASITQPLREKREVLKELYRMETGVEYA